MGRPYALDHGSRWPEPVPFEPADQRVSVFTVRLPRNAVVLMGPEFVEREEERARRMCCGVWPIGIPVVTGSEAFLCYETGDMLIDAWARVAPGLLSVTQSDDA